MMKLDESVEINKAIMQEPKLDKKIVQAGKGEMKVCNTTKVHVTFRLDRELIPRLNGLVDYFKVNDRSKALNMMIERFSDMKDDKIRAVREIKDLMARKMISKDEL